MQDSQSKLAAPDRIEAHGRHLSVWQLLTWLAVAAGTALRFCRLDHQSLWMDEGYTAWMVSHPLGQIVRLTRADTAPPLFYLLLRWWSDLFGHEPEAALRSMTALCSALTLILAVGLARKFLFKPAAVAAALWALALGFHQVFYAQEARFYPLMALLLVAAMLCLLRHLAAQHRAWLIPLTLLLAASLYTHNVMMPYVASLALVWLILPSHHRPRRRITDIALTAAIVAILYAPWGIFCLPNQLRIVHGEFWVSRPGATDITNLIAWLADVPETWSWRAMGARLHAPEFAGHILLAIGLALVAASLLLSLLRQRGPRLRQAIAMILLAFFPPLLVAAYSRLATPILMTKTFLPSAALMPIVLLLPMNLALSPWARRAVGAGAILMLLLAAGDLLAYETVHQNEDWRGVARWVAQLPPRHRLLVFVSEDGQLPFDYYYFYRPDESATGVPAAFLDRDPPRAMLRVQKAQDLARLESRLAQQPYPQVILILSHLFWADPDELTLKKLQSLFPNAQRQTLGELTIVRFSRDNGGEVGP